MIWHIFKKDFRLLWLQVTGIAVANLAQRVALARADRAGRDLELLNNFGIVALLATAILIVVMVHQDRLPGFRQDWLVRPIRRRDLLAAKLLFVVLLVQGPILAAETAQGLIAGLPLGPAAATALSRSVWMVLAMDLPCVALAALTRNLAQAIGAALAGGLAFVLVLASDLSSRSDAGSPPIRWATVGWVAGTAQALWGLAAVAAILALAYGRRKTGPARWVLACAALVWIFIETIPLGAAFAIQQRVSTQSGAAGSVRIAFDPTAGKWTGGRAGNPESIRFWKNVPERAAFLYLPLRVEGLGESRWLLSDGITVRITDSAGKPVELYTVSSPREFRESTVYQMVTVRESSYNLVKDQPLRLQLDYLLTLMKSGPAATVPANGTRWVPDLGVCTATPYAGGTRLNLRCVAPGPLACMQWFGENARTGQRGEPAPPPRRGGPYHPGNICWPDYSPYIAGIGGDPAVTYEARVPLTGLAAPGQFNDLRLVGRIDRPQAHFTREIIMPKIRLSQWRVE
jgi:hypothetical protein